ncbi:hypothetical protein RQP54_17600 [Curvibacter sp. APW13]|uniref:hypothetical protein n=1 Tax=Curvibacter sp. APW13 TaxID=3077236 RepID=UPI0028DD5BEE|nr:hypothetical protein [Curvibacter sp. APW13]MDT8992691.1 hypothetical protein [Curvibacter sp. APW13]
MNTEGLILQALPPIEIAMFDDAQFHHEPRMRLLQRCFHDLRRQKDSWAAMGMMGAKARAEAHTGPHLGEVLARATLPRATLHPRHDVQIRTAHTLANDLGTVVASLGDMCGPSEVPDGGILWCGLGTDELPSRLQIVNDQVWLTAVYDPIKDAHNPLNRLGSVRPLHGGMEVACVFWTMPIPTQKAFYRIQEIAELAHWALRQPKYAPQAS